MKTTCQCKDYCGGSSKFMYQLSIPEYNKTVMISNMYNSRQLSKYPLWLFGALEDFELFHDNCKCGLYGDWSKIERKVFDFLYHWFALQVAHVFYRDAALIEVNQLTWIPGSFALLYPLFLCVAICNIVIVFRLSIKESMAFIIQLFQFISSALSLTFSPSWIYQLLKVIIDYDNEDRFNLYFNLVSNTFVLWTQFLSVSLMLDRVLCIWKPMAYKTKATRKVALLLTLMLFLFSVAISSLNVFSELKVDLNQLMLLNFSAYFIMALIFLICLLLQIFFLVAFLLILKERTDQSSSQLKKRQRNLNRIMISTGIIETVLALCNVTSKFAWAFFFLMAYRQAYLLANDIMYWGLATLVIAPPIIGCAPVVTMIVCLILSPMYRTALASLFCYQSKSNNIVPSTMGLSRTGTTQLM